MAEVCLDSWSELTEIVEHMHAHIMFVIAGTTMGQVVDMADQAGKEILLRTRED